MKQRNHRQLVHKKKKYVLQTIFLTIGKEPYDSYLPFSELVIDGLVKIEKKDCNCY